MIASKAGFGTASGQCPSRPHQESRNNGSATVNEPNVVANGGLSSPIFLIHTRPSDCVTTAANSAANPIAAPAASDNPPLNTSGNPIRPSTMPANLLAVSDSSLSHKPAPRLVISGDNPNSTAIIPEPTYCEHQYTNTRVPNMLKPLAR